MIGGFIEERYKGNIHKFSHQMNTQDGVSYITLLYFPELPGFLKHLPAQTTLVLIELLDGAQDLKDYQHPNNATYLFGRETTGIEADQLTEIEDYFERLNASVPPEYLEDHKKTAHLHKIKIDTPQSLNVGVCASIVMYDAKNRHAPG